jgi:hypothetical protein
MFAQICYESTEEITVLYYSWLKYIFLVYDKKIKYHHLKPVSFFCVIGNTHRYHNVTFNPVFLLNIFIMHSFSLLLILLLSRSSVVSVCVKSGWMMKWREEGLLLLCWVVEHWQDVVLLDHRFDCSRGWVWSVSVWKVGEWWSDEKKSCCYFVDL